MNQLHTFALPISLRLMAMLAPLVPLFIAGLLQNDNQLDVILSLMIFYSQIIRGGLEHEFIERNEVKSFLHTFVRSYIYRSILFFPILIIYTTLNNIELYLIHISCFILFSLMSGLAAHFLPANNKIKSNIFSMQFPIWFGSIFLLLNFNTYSFFIGIFLGSIVGIIISLHSLLIKGSKINKSNKKSSYKLNYKNSMALNYRVINIILISIYAWILPVQISLELDNEWILFIFRALIVVALPIILFNSVFLNSISTSRKNKFKNFFILNKINLAYLLAISIIGAILYNFAPIYEGMPDRVIFLTIFSVITINALSSPYNSLLIVNGRIVTVTKFCILISLLVASIYFLFNISFLMMWTLFNFSFSLGIIFIALRFISLNNKTNTQ